MGTFDRRPHAVRRRLWRELLAASLDLVLPPHCPGCGAGRSDMDSGHRLCRPCRVHLERLDGGGCRRCGEPSATPGACAFDHRALRGLAFARAPFRYRGTGGALVRRLKLGGDFGALSVLELAMAEAVAPRLLPSWRRAVVVPVPLHRARRRARGFDQAELLAEAVAHRLLLRCEPGCLRRRRATMPQGDPQVLSRTQNVEGAFEVARGAAVTGERVLLVDDVATSFATARACAAELILAGVREVALLTSCRARSPMASL